MSCARNPSSTSKGINVLMNLVNQKRCMDPNSVYCCKDEALGGNKIDRLGIDYIPAVTYDKYRAKPKNTQTGSQVGKENPSSAQHQTTEEGASSHGKLRSSKTRVTDPVRKLKKVEPPSQPGFFPDLKKVIHSQEGVP